MVQISPDLCLMNTFARYWPGINKSKYMLEQTERQMLCFPQVNTSGGKGAYVTVEDCEVSKVLKT